MQTSSGSVNVNSSIAVTKNVGNSLTSSPAGQEPQDIVLSIKGMHCAGCATRIERVLGEQAGIKSANVNLAMEQADIQFEPKRIRYEAVVHLIKDAGFEVPTQAIALDIEGMTCASCAQRVEKALMAVSGVVDARVNAATNQADVDWIGTDANLLVDAATLAGYPAKLRLSSLVLRKQQSDAQAHDARVAGQRELRMFFISLALTLPLVLQMIAHMSAPITGLSFQISGWMELALATPVQFWVGWRFYKGAWSALKARAGSMDTLVVMGTSAAYFFSLYMLVKLGDGATGHLYFEAAAVIITLVLLGKILELRAKRGTTAAIFELMSLRPDTANVIRDGQEIPLSLDEVKLNDIVIVRPGERIAVDGEIVEGHSHADESLITGESFPVEKTSGDQVIGASINGTGLLQIRATSIGEDTTLSKIIRMVENAQSGKAPIQRMVDKISAIFVPTIIAIAILTFIGWMIIDGNFERALIASVSVLVIACPCALGLATPTAIVAGTGAAAKAGILFKDVAALENAHRVDCVIFDKTGTLTRGHPAVSDLVSVDLNEEKFLQYCASLQRASEHPLAQAVVRLGEERSCQILPVTNFNSHTGFGVSGKVDGKKISIGNINLMQKENITINDELKPLQTKWETQGKTAVYVAIDGQNCGIFGIADPLRTQTPSAVKRLENKGIDVVMLTGDAQRTAKSIAEAAGIKRFVAQTLPADKAAYIEQLQSQGKRVAMVGDGVNDAPALALADVGIAMGSGSDVAMESAGITLMRSDPNLVYDALQVSKSTWNKLHQNLFWAFIYNIIGIPLAVLGLLNPAIAGAAMALSSVSVVTSSLMLRFWKPTR